MIIKVRLALCLLNSRILQCNKNVAILHRTLTLGNTILGGGLVTLTQISEQDSATAVTN